MKEIVVISGKGGTGKTSITASFAKLGAEEIVVADCDVDAADMHLVMSPEVIHTEDYYSGFVAKIDENKCTQCGACIDTCQFDAISPEFNINQYKCEGCSYCSEICPSHAIKMQELCIGQYFISKSRMNNYLIHAKLGIGADNTGKLVAIVKKEARKIAKANNLNTILVDGSPGIGCPVLSSLTGANLVCIVTESSLSGFHDLQRVYEVAKRFKLKSCCIINKHDLNTKLTKQIEDYLEKEGIIHLANLPYMANFSDAMVEGKTIVEKENTIHSQLIKDSWQKIKEIVV